MCGCVIPQCENTFFSKCNIPIPDIFQCLTLASENVPPKLDAAPPLCKHHYHVVYNTYKPTQTHCPTCYTWFHKQNARPCPDVASIATYLAEKTGYEGTLRQNDKVCFSCYKFHLHILKCNVNESTDTDLQVLIQGIKHTMLKPEQVVSADDAVSRAMSVTTVYVGEALLRQEGLLLPDVHNSFIQEINSSTWGWSESLELPPLSLPPSFLYPFPLSPSIFPLPPPPHPFPLFIYPPLSLSLFLYVPHRIRLRNIKEAFKELEEICHEHFDCKAKTKLMILRQAIGKLEHEVKGA